MYEMIIKFLSIALQLMKKQAGKIYMIFKLEYHFPKRELLVCRSRKDRQ